MHFYCWLHCCD